MSKIIYNDRAYGEIIGGGGAGGLGGGIELTQAEYNALDQSEKDKDIIYFITDGNPEGMVVNDSVPIGSIQAYAGANPPGNWLICAGQAISRTTYQKLFSVIGTTYGTGDGSTTFNLPDLRGKVTMGQSSTYELGTSGGETTHTLSIEEMPSHTHTNLYHSSSTSQSWGYNFESNGQRSAQSESSGGIGLTGGGEAHNNMQPYLVTNYIIKVLDSSIIETEKPNFLNLFYPVGSYYETSDTTFNPNVLWGGIWSNEGVVDDYIVDEDIDGIWTFRKWASGIAECWTTTCLQDSSAPQDGAEGNIYWRRSGDINFPSGLFIDVPSCTVWTGNGASYLNWTSMRALSKNGISWYYVYDMSVSMAPYWNINAKGVWQTLSVTSKYRWHRTA